MNITNVFSIGYRCNTDDFLKIMDIRKCSSPFSYMVIDVRTALNFIDDEFKNFLNDDQINHCNSTFLYNRQPWNHYLYIHNVTRVPHPHPDIIHDMDTVCIWNHHNLQDDEIIKKIHRRAMHLIHCLHNESKQTLLFYIEKLQRYTDEKDVYFDTSIFEKYSCKFLVLVPLIDFYSNTPVIQYHDNKAYVIYFKSNNVANIDDHKDQWVMLHRILESIYEFKIN